jgi:hypothetical protein
LQDAQDVNRPSVTQTWHGSAPRVAFAMLPEFPRGHEAIQKVWNKLMFAALGFSDPLMSQIPIRPQKEGNRAAWGDSPITYKKKSVSYKWSPELGKGIPTETYFGMPLELGKEMALKQAKDVFTLIETPTPHTGTIGKDEGPLNLDLWISKMDSFEINFDENGVPLWPQFFLTKDAQAEIVQSMRSPTPEQLQKLSELVAKKRREFDEREARRRLVD